MIEQDIARLWERAADPKGRWDAAAARAELRALGLNPHSPPPAVETSAEDSGTPDQVRGDDEAAGDEEGAGNDEAAGDARESDQVRGDDEGEGVAPPPVVTPAPRQARDERPCGPAGAQDDDAVPDAPGPRLREDDDETDDAGEPAAPARAPRHNEWSRQKMVGFLRELAACHNVSQAAKSVGMGRQSAYKLRNRMSGTPFALAWEAALETGLQQLAHALMDRALNGEEVAHYYQGELVGTSRKFDNRLGAWLLENPARLGREYAARGVAAHEWENLLERIESDCLDWYEGETLMCAPAHLIDLGDADYDGEGEGEGFGDE